MIRTEMRRQSSRNDDKSINGYAAKNEPIASPLPEQGSTISRTFTRQPVNKSENAVQRLAARRHAADNSIAISRGESLIHLRSLRDRSRPTRESAEENRIVTINVSGHRFQTYLSTLALYPNTLLGNEKKRQLYWNPEAKEYFFDRHRACFEAILYFYQSNGRLRRPDFVPLDTFLEEIYFFELGPEACHEVHKLENISEMKRIQMPKMLWRRYIWFYFELPQHSKLARLIHLVSMLFTVLSCIALAVETLPQYTNRWDDICLEQANLSLTSSFVPRCSALFYSPFFIIQTVCVAFFTVEFSLRLISTPSYRRFIFSFFNWIDLAAIVPYYVFLGIQLSDTHIQLNSSAVLGLRLLRVLRFSRVFKIYLVFKRLKSLRVLSATIKESLIDFAVMVTILTLLAFLFGAATYFAEEKTNGDVFDSIPKSIYWGIITITGVGYGDMCPVTPIGRILTCLCALFGPATMGMLISVLVDRYQRVYNRKMYVPEHMESVDLDDLNIDPNGKVDYVTRKLSQGQLSLTRVPTRLLSIGKNGKKYDERQTSHVPGKVQFVISFNDDDMDDETADQMVTDLKEKLTKVVLNTGSDIDLRLINSDPTESSMISTFDSVSDSIMSETTTLTNDEIHTVEQGTL